MDILYKVNVYSLDECGEIEGSTEEFFTKTLDMVRTVV